MKGNSGVSFSDWITRPRQILGLFAITLALAALSASHKAHLCDAQRSSGQAGLHWVNSIRLKPGARDGPYHPWGHPPGTDLGEDGLTGEEATQISEELISRASQDDLEDDLAEEVGMQEGGGDEVEGGEESEASGSGASEVFDAPSDDQDGGSPDDGEAGPSPLSEEGGFCPAIYKRTGDGCDYTSTPAAFHKYFKGAFEGGLILTSTSLKDKTVIAVSTPGKSRKSKLTDVTPALLNLLPRRDSIFGKNFSRCAVIGSSGILLKYEHGEEIDSHDMVLRFNSAKTKGFEKHVGGKTTHRLTNSRNFGFRESKSEQVLVHLRTPGAMRALIQRLHRKNRSVLYGLNPAWYAYMDKNLSFLSTSGLNGIVMALHRCNHVRLYGFHVHPRHGVPYHYYNVKDKPANVGRDDSEWLVVKHLIENNLVELGEPCILECNENQSECQKCIQNNQ